MTLQQWYENDWLKTHEPSRKEMSDLLAIVDRDIEEARHAVSPDWQFGIAYNAALKLCTMLLHATGYRAGHSLQHFRTIQALSLILGDERKLDTKYLDTCRLKRNIIEYECVGAVTANDADELIRFAEELRGAVLSWLEHEHANLTP